MVTKTFLQIVSADLFSVFGGDYSNLTLVFPNKRASLFINESLASCAGDRYMWTPSYATISDIFESLSDLVIADPIYLVTRLYQVYCEVTGSEETIDRFYVWGEQMLSDFDDIDNNMVDAEKLFVNIADLNDLTRYDYFTDAQREVLKRFFVNFDPDHKTELKDNFNTVWQHLLHIYQRFRQVLIAEGKAYGGLQKRRVVERIEECSPQYEAILETSHYALLGFNVLSESEKRLFLFLKQHRQTLFYWDYDNFYLNYEAGSFIRQNMRIFPNRLADSDIYDNMLSQRGKNITIISSPSENAQCRYASRWLQSEGVTADVHSAIVLCNEKVLNPVLHSLPSAVGDTPLSLNVTMGYPLIDTPIYSFVSTLLDLQTHGRTQNGKWRYSFVSAVLKHPYTQFLTDNAAQQLLSHINRRALILLDDSLFADHPFLAQVFTPCDDSVQLIQYLSDIIKSVVTMPADSPLLSESFYDAYLMVSRLGTLQQSLDAFSVSKDTLSRLLTHLLRSKSIPFHGEPAVGLQVMGLLETRNLDFSNLLLMSVNEGQMPKISHNNSFIPYTLREVHGMTTIEKQVSMYAYYFYRLLQRADNITIMFNSGTDGINKGEMSRFVLQLLLDSNRLQQAGIHIVQKKLTARNAILQTAQNDVVNSPQVNDRLVRRFDIRYEQQYKEQHGGATMTLSPSAINDYIDCHRLFFYKYVSTPRVTEELTDDVDDSMFGTIFHYCMEMIYKPLRGRQVQSSYLLALAGDDAYIDRLLDEAFAVNFFKMPRHQPSYHVTYNGQQLLNKHVLKTYIKSQLAYDASLCPFRLLGTEAQAYTVVTVNNGVQDLNIRIGGIIDRYEQVTDPATGSQSIRICDYKTSRSPQLTKSLEELFAQVSKRSHHIFQALYYCDVLTEQGNKAVYPLLQYVKLRQQDRHPYTLIDKTEIRDYLTELKDDYHSRLIAVIREMFDPDTTFDMTTVKETCSFCQFKQLCGK